MPVMNLLLDQGMNYSFNDFYKVGDKWVTVLQNRVETEMVYPKPITADYTGDGRPDLLVVDEVAGEAILLSG